jgi:hypothetical protein
MTRRTILTAVLAVALAGCSVSDSGQGLSGGAPDFTLPAVDGSMVSMSDYSGKVVILGVSLDKDGLGVLGSFVHDNMIPYKVVMGDNRISNAFGGVSSIPTLYMVNREGRLVRKLTGYHSYRQLEEQVKRYL